jgi:iron complex outermembrane recepter protein
MSNGFNRSERAAFFRVGAAFTALITAPAIAQMAPAEDANEAEGAGEIVVSGYRRSIEEAIDMKRETVGFSDSIVATDIADFPEQNLSEALQRLPGTCARSIATLMATSTSPPAIS